MMGKEQHLQRRGSSGRPVMVRVPRFDAIVLHGILDEGASFIGKSSARSDRQAACFPLEPTDGSGI